MVATTFGVFAIHGGLYILPYGSGMGSPCTYLGDSARWEILQRKNKQKFHV